MLARRGLQRRPGQRRPLGRARARATGRQLTVAAIPFPETRAYVQRVLQRRSATIARPTRSELGLAAERGTEAARSTLGYRRRSHACPTSSSTPSSRRPPTSRRRSTRSPRAIEAGERFQTLLGATGTGKTMTMAGVIEAVQRPTLVIAHNKTLAAQLCNEFRTFFPDNAVEYFVSYYDYYQPEAYVPSRDLYIEKDSAINQEVDRLRHAATAAVFARRDVIVVASVSCIYGLGSPETYEMNMQILQPRRDDRPRRAAAQARLDPVHAQRHGALARQLPRARRDARGVPGLRRDGLPRDAVRRRGRAPAALRPADRRADRGRPRARRDLAGDALQRQGGHDRGGGRGDRRASSNERCEQLEAEGKLLESHRLRQRTQYDMEMLREVGLLLGDRELLADPRRTPAGRAARTA